MDRKRILFVAPWVIAAVLLSGTSRAEDVAAAPRSAVEIGWRLQDLARSHQLLRDSIRGLRTQIANSPDGVATRRYHWVESSGVHTELELTRAEALANLRDLEAEQQALAADVHQLESERLEAVRRRAAEAEHLAEVLTARPDAVSSPDDPS